MRILITGSEGVLGTHLKKELRLRGHDVYGCDLVHCEDPKVLRADIAIRRQLTRVFDFARPELVYHFAAEFGRINGQEYYEQLWKTNCIGTRNTIEECLRTKSILAFASSSEAYGLVDEYAPSDEDFKEGWLDLYAPQFHNEYALSKWTGERQIYMAARNEGLKAVVFRFFNAYGPGEPYSPYRSVVCLFAYRLLTGQPITVYQNYFRTHMWVGDWCQTVANLARCTSITEFVPINVSDPAADGWPGSRGCNFGGGTVPVFNIGGEEYESVEALKDKLIALIKPASPIINYVPVEKANVVSKKPDNRLARSWLGHSATTTLDEGLPQTIEWLKEHYGL